jgi:hypothetical protein
MLAKLFHYNGKTSIVENIAHTQQMVQMSKQKATIELNGRSLLIVCDRDELTFVKLKAHTKLSDVTSPAFEDLHPIMDAPSLRLAPVKSRGASSKKSTAPSGGSDELCLFP